jgi:hypothetical protein
MPAKTPGSRKVGGQKTSPELQASFGDSLRRAHERAKRTQKK